MKSTDLILSLCGKEFKEFYAKELLPVLLQLEQARKVMWQKFLKVAIINVIIAVPLVIFLFSYFIAQNHKIDGDFLFIIGISLIPTLWAGYTFFTGVKKLLNTNIMPTLFSYWGDFKFCQEPLYSGTTLRSLLENLKIFPRHNGYSVDDCIEGKYNGLDLKIVEANVTYETGSGKNSRKENIFKGLMLEISMNKVAPLHMVVKTDVGSYNHKQLDKLKRVALEDVEFEKEFEVFADDQIEARYILTTAFMDRLTNYKRTKGHKIEVTFYKEKAYFFVWFSGDKFAVPVTKSVVNFSYYQNILTELAQILALVDALKLEQKIGL